jgi:lipopolysaccharide transport system ATP-binding protein
MSDIAIRAEGLGKRYRIGTSRARYGTLRDSLSQTFTAPFKRFRRNDNGHLTSDLRPPTSGDSIWALKDVSFEVKRGEVVGIIGRNGAGKSTLLKVLSRITEPTTGAVDIYGRVGSLLEVGTGFHPELTGRENIYLNGAILGMKKTEIENRFDEIVSFAEVRQFIETPVKHYSSGMYLRLAFAVAAHLEPEILIVDEVLAVGDAQFQKKCLGKMGDVAKQGRTVLFVSHNMGAMRTLCDVCLLLRNGKIEVSGKPSKIIQTYLASNTAMTGHWARAKRDDDSGTLIFNEVRILNKNGETAGTISSDQGFTLAINLTAKCSMSGIQFAIRFTNQEGVAVFTTTSTDWTGAFANLEQGQYALAVDIPGSFLAPGIYSLILAAMRPNENIYDIIEDNLVVEIEDMGTGRSFLNDGRLGVVTPVIEWRNELTSPGHNCVQTK